MIVLMGTYPDKHPGIIEGYAGISNRELSIGNKSIEISMGTPCMAATCAHVCSALEIEPPYCVMAGDIGNGEGSMNLYSYLREDVFELAPDIITLHYIIPLIDQMVDFGFALEEHSNSKKPLLIADAGGMYAAKISGIGNIFDIFTPDRGELAFLADKDAMHPMFVNENLYDFPDERIPELAMKASLTGLSADTLLVKGNMDYIVRGGSIKAAVDTPNIPAMEAVGGTGDTLTGIISALLSWSKPVTNACIMAARINRIAGKCCNIQPDTHISSMIAKIPEALEIVMQEFIKFGKYANLKTA